MVTSANNAPELRPVGQRVKGADLLTQKQAAGRMEILDAAAIAFTERGFAATSIDTIADLLGATKGRVYHYYRTKGEIFLDLHRHGLDVAIATLEPIARAPISAPDRLRQMVLVNANLIGTHYHLYKVSLLPLELDLAGEGRTKKESIRSILAMRRSFEGLYQDVLRDGVASKDFGDLDPRLASKFILGAVNWMLMWFNPTTKGLSAEEIGEQLAHFVLEGVNKRVPRTRPASKR